MPVNSLSSGYTIVNKMDEKNLSPHGVSILMRETNDKHKYHSLRLQLILQSQNKSEKWEKKTHWQEERFHFR